MAPAITTDYSHEGVFLCVSTMLWKDTGYIGLIAGISRAHFLELHQLATGRSVHWKHCHGHHADLLLSLEK